MNEHKSYSSATWGAYGVLTDEKDTPQSRALQEFCDRNTAGSFDWAVEF